MFHAMCDFKLKLYLKIYINVKIAVLSQSANIVSFVSLTVVVYALFREIFLSGISSKATRIYVLKDQQDQFHLGFKC